jgi:hypothetical protein
MTTRRKLLQTGSPLADIVELPATAQWVELEPKAEICRGR